jgi:hypothetical protein
MITSLVHYALENGCLSVASESLLRQLINMKIYTPSDLEALANLKRACNSGKIKREACYQANLLDLWEKCELIVN